MSSEKKERKLWEDVETKDKVDDSVFYRGGTFNRLYKVVHTKYNTVERIQYVFFRETNKRKLIAIPKKTFILDFIVHGKAYWH